MGGTAGEILGRDPHRRLLREATNRACSAFVIASPLEVEGPGQRTETVSDAFGIHMLPLSQEGQIWDWRRRPDLNRGGGFADLTRTSICATIDLFSERFRCTTPPRSARNRRQWLARWLPRPAGCFCEHAPARRHRRAAQTTRQSFPYFEDPRLSLSDTHTRRFAPAASTLEINRVRARGGCGGTSCYADRPNPARDSALMAGTIVRSAICEPQRRDDSALCCEPRGNCGFSLVSLLLVRRIKTRR